MDYMPFISCAVFLFVSLFPGEYRRTAFVLFLAFAINIFLLPVYTHMVETDDLSVSFLCGGIDAITAYFMLRYGGKHKIAQGIILITAVLMNAASLLTPPSIIYNYIIFVMNLAQIVLIFGGIYGATKRVWALYFCGLAVSWGSRANRINLRVEEEKE